MKPTALIEDHRGRAEHYRRLLRGMGRPGKAHRAGRRQEHLARLAREPERIRENDFFDAGG